MIKRVVMTAGLLGLWVATPAQAADNAMQVCGAKYQAAKKANQLPAGQTWNQYLAACRAGMKPAAAAAPAPAAKPAPMAKPAVVAKTTTTTTTSTKPQSAGQMAAHDRQKQCGQMWKADKAAGKIPAGQTWPKYWSQCNTKLKG